MKKLLLSILIIFNMVTPLYAETCTFDGSTDTSWNTAANWTCDGGDKVPAANDVVVIPDTKTVVWDVKVIPATGALASLTGQGSGQITLNNSVCGAGSACSMSVTGDITASTKGATGFIAISGSTDSTVTITAANIIGGATNSCAAIVDSRTNTTAGGLTLVGAVKGATGAYASAYGFNATGANSKIVVTGSCTGGGGATSYGCNLSLASQTFTLTGDTTGGSGSRAAGVFSLATTATLVGNKIESSTAGGWDGVPPSTWDTANAKYYLQSAAGSIKLYADTDPGVAQVKSGTTYYFQSNTVKTGTMSAGGGGWGH